MMRTNLRQPASSKKGGRSTLQAICDRGLLIRLAFLGRHPQKIAVRGCELVKLGERGPERSQQAGRNYQGAINRPNHPARSLQMGAPDLWRTRFEKRSQSICPERLRRWCSDRYATEPSLWRPEIHPAAAAAGASDAATAHPRPVR